MEFEHILMEKQAGIATITLNRERYGNALARESYGEIRDAVKDCQADAGVRCIVIRSTGRHFSAGGDIARFQRLIEAGEYLNEENIRYAGEMTTAIRRCEKPVIAMVQGVATGAGCSLAVACDFRVATPSSKFVMGFIKLGLTGDTGSMYFLHKLVGIAKASEMLMLGAPVGGEEALRMGLVTRLADEGALEAQTYALARTLAAYPTAALALQKRCLMEFFYQDLERYSERESQYLTQVSRTRDFAEAVGAFLEKRTPEFIGS